MPKRKFNNAYQVAQARASARAILTKLGVTRFPEINDEEPFVEREPETIITAPKRFRRTKQEMQELEAFTQWQLERRLQRINNESNLEAFGASA